MATEQLEATRANDARVAEAMGLVRLTTSQIEYWWLGNPTSIGAVEYFGTIRAYEDFLDAYKDEDAEDDVPHYLTDPALVVPMMERIGELAAAQVVLKRWQREEWPWTCHVLNADTIVWSAATANLALAAALLEVWAQRREAS